jgi:hypothetical protein
MTARDFIENKLLPTAKDWNYTAMARYIEACRDEWDKPDTGVVDEEAFTKATAAFDEKDPFRYWNLVQAYEQAKLNKATVAESVASFVDLWNKACDRVNEAQTAAPRPLPALPEMLSLGVAIVDKDIYTLGLKINQLIDYLKSREI